MKIKNRFESNQEPLYLIDGTSFVYRAFYAFPDLSRSDGFPTNALYIVLRLLLKILKEEEPVYCCFIMDGRGPTFREKIFPEYKAQRMKMPEPLTKQLPPLQAGVDLLGLTLLQGENSEADDHIASLCYRFKKDRPVVIIGSDKDLNQCLDPNVILWDPGQRQEKITTLKDFKAKEQLSPSQWPDFQALVGDSSDNIPGVPGIGPKTALKILKNFPSLEEIKENLSLLAKKEQEKISAHLEEIFLYRELTWLKLDLDLDFDLERLKVSAWDKDKLTQFFQEYEFRSLVNELSEQDPGFKTKKKPRLNVQEINIDSLAPLSGKKLGLFPSDSSGFFLGLGRAEYLISCQTSPLVQSLNQVETIYLYSLKDLLSQDPSWQKLNEAKIFDLSLAAYLLNPEERDYSWNRLLKIYSQELNVSSENPALAALELGEILNRQLRQAGLLELLQETETPLVRILKKMEDQGVKIDLLAFEEFLKEVEVEIQGLSQRIFELAGEDFNLRSAPQTAQVLFEKLGLKPGRKTPGGVPSTSSQVLEGLQSQHEIIPKILKFRSLEKIRSTYLSPLPKQVDQNWRLHTHFNQLATATGRLSSSNPNLQNIPIKGEFGPRMRSCFIPEKGHLLLAADYSQIELRILAHMSKEPNLVQAFQDNEDIHTRTASLLFEEQTENVSKDQRRKAKTINFGLIYGMGPQKLSRELGISLNAAKEFITIYFSKLEKVSSFFEQVEKKAKEQGYVTTILGRRRLVQDINSRNAQLAGQAKRMAINTIIQGSAADIIKLAMLQSEADPLLKELKAELILQIHDELLFEIPEENALKAGKRVAEIMSRVYELDLPLTVDWGVGENWSQAH